VGARTRLDRRESFSRHGLASAGQQGQDGHGTRHVAAASQGHS
jgi:hypothetical protein